MSAVHEAGVAGKSSSTENQPERRRIGPICFEWTDREGALHQIMSAVSLTTGRVFAFCNMHTFNMAHRSQPVAHALRHATVFNDGVGIDIASRVLFGSPFPENLNGTDLTSALFDKLQKPVRVYVIGSAPGVPERAAAALRQRFPNVETVGTQHGFFDDAESDRVVADILDTRAELVLVGMGNPRQELWATEAAARLPVVYLCVGAYIDFIAGRFRRAPRWIRRIRCEWLFRLALEPSRLWRRYLLGAPIFLYAIVQARLQSSARGG